MRVSKAERLPSASPRPPADLNPRRDPPLDFPDRDYGELGPADYQALGFMAGLEVHQQLATASKLFCRCPAGRTATTVHTEVLRHMRPTLSELGEYDGCALMEFKTRKEIVYQLDRALVCTYEIDDTPPFPIDEEAVHIALEVARLCDLNLVSELHVMRKQYLDGSIPTGFQRTAMVGLTGQVPFTESEIGRDRVLRIRQLSLEEDSCRELSDHAHRIVFQTDRLGTPLTELVTEPDLLTPAEVRAGGRLLARVARATGKVRRGPGAARQDVNVSVAGGRRTELKGVDHHKGLPKLVHIEAYRQLQLLRVKAELERRGVTRELLPTPPQGVPWETSPLVIDARPIIRRSVFAPLQDALERGEGVCAVRLPGFRGLLVHPTQPGRTFAREFSDRLRVIACLTGQPFMSHSDVPDFGIEPGRWRQLRHALGGASGDAVVLVWGDRRDVATAARELIERARDALDGVPAETRQAYRDGTNGFERILPGPDRMYPDTDTPPVLIPDAWVATAERDLPERPWAREARYVALGLGEVSARRLAAADWAELFDAIAPPAGLAATRLAAALEKRLVAWWREIGAVVRPPPERVRSLAVAVANARVHHTGFETVFDRLLREPGVPADVIVGEHAVGPDVEAHISRRIAAVLAASASWSGRPPEVRMRWAMGEVMPGLRGRADPREVSRRLAAAFEEAGE